jgi:hypothetical protein
MERIGFVSGSRMSRRYLVSADDAQSGGFERFEQLRAGSQTEMLRQIGKDQPSLCARLQMLGQRSQESAQHSAFRIINAAFHGRARPCGNPWWVTDDERRSSFRKKVRQHDFDALRKPQPVNVLTRTRQRSWIQIGSDYAPESTPGKHRSEHTGTGADIEGNAG